MDGHHYQNPQAAAWLRSGLATTGSNDFDEKCEEIAYCPGRKMQQTRNKKESYFEILPVAF